MKLRFLFMFMLGITCSALFSQAPAINPIQGSNVVCLSSNSPGASYSVTASNSPTSYSWSVAGAGGVTLVNPSAAICSLVFSSPFANSSCTLSCYATNSSGDSQVVTLVVSVFVTPSITFSGANYFCQGTGGGTGTQLSASPTIFQASSTTISYFWSPPTGLSSTTSASVTANPPSTTNYTVLLMNGPCTNTNYLTVTVHQPPVLSAVLQPTAICLGKNAVLTLSGGTSYSVNAINTPFLTNLSPNVTTGYVLTTSDSNGCVSQPAYVTVSVMPLPVISAFANPPTICSGAGSTLNMTGAVNYTVNGNPSGASLNVSPSMTTLYTIKGTGTNGCESQAQQVNLVVNAPPGILVNAQAQNNTICEGESTKLLLNGASTYTLNGSPSPPSAPVAPTVSTTYTVEATDANGCKNMVTYLLTVNSCTGLDELSKGAEELHVFPNPNNGSFTIRASAGERALILNELGQTVKTLSMEAGAASEISDLAPGIYFVIAGNARQKIVVTR